MSKRFSIPSYRLHKASGQAIVTLPDRCGGRRDVLLGAYRTAASKAEYERVVAEWLACGRSMPTTIVSTPALTVDELVLAFWRHVESYYRRSDGTPTNEVQEYKYTLRVLRELYGPQPAQSFGPLALKAIRQRMIDRQLARGVINQRIGRIRRAFKWAVENELVPPQVYHGLLAVPGLRRGRSAARETVPIRPVAEALVHDTLPYLRPQVAAMVQLQHLAGMRPGEVVVMRGIDLDMTGSVWLYTPGSDQAGVGQHKTAHHGHRRVIALGPRAQAIIQAWLRTNVLEYLFQPREAEAARDAERRCRRKSKVTPSQARRQPKRHPRKQPGERYTTSSYHHAIRGAITALNRARACADCKRKPPADRCVDCKAQAAPYWHPHQLRHSRATELRRRAGLDVARVVLGHRSLAMTEAYAELDVNKAVAIMSQIG